MTQYCSKVFVCEGDKSINLVNITTYSLSLEISLTVIENKSVHQKREDYMNIFKYFRTPKQVVTLEKRQGRGSRIKAKGSERVS